jgi:hypothetical protein
MHFDVEAGDERLGQGAGLRSTATRESGLVGIRRLAYNRDIFARRRIRIVPHEAENWGRNPEANLLKRGFGGATPKRIS